MMIAKEAIEQRELSDVELNAVAGGACANGKHILSAEISVRPSGPNVIQEVMRTVFGL